MLKDATRLLAALGVIAAISAIYTAWLGVTNLTTIALTFLLVVLIVATTSRLWVALTASVVSMLVFNYFFLPPLGTLAVTDPANWAALITFLAVSLVASNLSSAVRLREQDALNQRDEMTRLFELSRDVILMTDSREAISGLAQFIARRFALDYVAICLPRADDWEISQSGELSQPLDASELTAAFTGAGYLLHAAQADRDVAAVKKEAFLPASFTSADSRTLMETYIDSTEPNPNYLKLIADAPIDSKTGVDAKLVVKAKRRYDAMVEDLFKTTPGFNTGCTVSVSSTQVEPAEATLNDMVIEYTFSEAWLEARWTSRQC